ncbi:hypothetical protein FNB79_01890 [Formosa sediminum]|uniref:Tetratricopeptide repeat protein n=1 Tax=Formosa sediminum TaxID=2594004 RepID=A0A516GML9_9FLAO|nr:hypothetical protein [Formosa sediminum]QDO92776.1 hypothetical protein FNB79_01890 [Formosa sediminum]
MTSTDFSHILQHPEALIPEQTGLLKSIIEEFPYFQPARALYLKGLKVNESFKYNQELKVTAAYTTDRSILFDFITSEAFVQNEISQFIKQNTLHLKNIDVDAINISNNNVTEYSTFEAEKSQPKISPAKLVHFSEDYSKALKVPSDSEAISEEKEEEKDLAATQIEDQNSLTNQDSEKSINAPETVLEIGKPLDFNNSETHSFNEWLKLTSYKPVNRDTDPIKQSIKAEGKKEDTKEVPSKPEAPHHITPETETKADNGPTPEQAKKFALIDKFISTNPKIDPKKSSGVSHNLAESHMLQPESLMTETLARIYVEQKNYKKAIQSYNILSLKYPEKSGFFADRIKAIKQIQEQNKKN